MANHWRKGSLTTHSPSFQHSSIPIFHVGGNVERIDVDRDEDAC
jgi:hypothetical protein